jgi:poly(beta-D-mannuronate) lyase
MLFASLFICGSAVAVEPPARLLDLSCWKLTLSVDTDRPGRPDEIEQPLLDAFADSRNFFVDEQVKGVVFRAHCGGATSKGSSYPRCELREMRPGGNGEAAWATDDGASHSMTARIAITKTPPVKQHVVCAQIHDANDDVLMVRLEGTKLFVERNSKGDVMLERNYSLGTPFDLKIQAGAGRIRLWHEGILKLDWESSRKGCYFKAGCYTQSNPSKGDDPGSYGEVVIYGLHVVHQQP